MKTYLKILFFALLAAVLFHSCGGEVEPDQIAWRKNLLKNDSFPNERWGEVHNLGLEAIEDSLKKRADLDNMTSSQIDSLIITWALKFTQAQNDSFRDNSTFDDLKNVQRDLTYLSPRATALFKDLDDVMSDYKLDMDIFAFQKRIIDVESKFRANTTGQDLEYLLQAASIARYSSAYWYTEGKKVQSKGLKGSEWQGEKQPKKPFPNAISASALGTEDRGLPRKDVGNKTMVISIVVSGRVKL